MKSDTTMLDHREDLPAGSGKGVPDEAALQHLLHDLNNVFVSILLNAQVIEWKLPSYSRIKRNVHEVERSAQRGGLLVERILQQTATGHAFGAMPPAAGAEECVGIPAGT
jgi:hypothetical protein